MEIVEKDIHRFQHAIRDHSDYDFTGYSLSSLRRRLTRIMLEYEIGMSQLTQRLITDKIFLDEIVRKITVHTTELFRDPEIWKILREVLFTRFHEKTSLSIWHSGCSTGQEIYSMMMILDDLGLLERTHIYGSDISSSVIEVAREGKYKYRFNQSYLENFERVLLNGTEEQRRNHKKSWKKYFTIDETKDVIQMKEFLRTKPVYKKLDLVKDPNLFFVNFDLIVCRNVIIYFNYELQNRVFDLFYNSMSSNGILVLGIHESILGPFANRFVKSDSFYYKKLV